MAPWDTAGNNATAGAFLGTTSKVPLVIKTNATADPTERVHVETNGNVGIGTPSPQKPLDVAGSGGIRIGQTAQAASTNEIYFADNGQIRSLDDNHRIIFNRAGNDLELREYGTITLSPGATQGNRTARVVFDASNVGIGMDVGTAPTDRLSVRGEEITPHGFGAAIGLSNIASGGRKWYFRAGATGTATPPGGLSIADDTSYRLVIDSSGNVGIGTPSPSQLLSVSGAESTGNGFGAAIGLSNSASGGRNWYLRAGATGTATPAGGFSIADDANYRLVIDSSGNVGIGTVSPSSLLHVQGDVTVNGDVLLTGADCAEQFYANGAEPPEAGTVVVIDENGALRESRDAYDKKVAGVVSGAGEYRHGLVLDKRGSEEGRVPVALVGKVYCKVDAQYSPIEIGDLLTSSPTPGHAMKAAEPSKAFGSVIGKALQPLEAGQGLIPILVSLQ